MYTSYGGNITMANRSMNYHSPNLFQILLNLQDMSPLHTTWRYSDLIAVVFMLIKLTHETHRCVLGDHSQTDFGDHSQKPHRHF